MPRLLTAAFLLAALFCASTARGQTDEEEARARKLFSQAEVHFNLQEFKKALELYTTAYKLRPLPGFLFNIGQCQRYLGKYEEALFSFKIYLVRVPNPPNRAQVEQLIDMIEKRLAQKKADRERARRDGDGKHKNDDKGKAAAAKGPEPPPYDEEEDDSKPPRTLWVWTGIATSAALLGAGFVAGQLASSRSTEYNDPATSIERREELKDPGETLRTASIATLSVGGLVAIGTLVYYYVGYRRYKKRRTGVTAVVPLRGGAALGVGGEF
jgi:tetratricopeptide (TPR) repeat protein